MMKSANKNEQTIRVNKHHQELQVQARQSADARILGQILVAQNILFTLPDSDRISEFCAQILISIPGICACCVCLGRKPVQAGMMAADLCAECKLTQRVHREDDALFQKTSGMACHRVDQTGICVLPIDSFHHRFGFFVLNVDQNEQAGLYQPLIRNLTNFVTLILENREQQNMLQKSRDDLECSVKERTQALTKANQALTASRVAALRSMRAANEARQHAEQVSAHLQREINERQQAEAEIRKLNIALEERVADRTAKLQSANRELEAFAYSVSHDLRAPVRHIEGFLELLEKKIQTVLDNQGRPYMDAIAASAIKMGTLIDDLLSFSRMGRYSLVFQLVDLGSLVNDILGELEPDTDGRDIDWYIDKLPVVSGDAATRRLVLTNLIANALKFTRSRGKARIEIGSLPTLEAEAVIFVRDNGAGFDMAYADKLFGVFQRLHRADEFEGTGIGLATVRRIIARHGGRTWAEGKMDQGAEFYFSLPQMTQGGVDGSFEANPAGRG